MLSEKRRDLEDPCNDPFERPGSRLPTKKRRPKQTVTREIEEAFEDEKAISEALSQREIQESRDVEDEQAAKDYSDYLASREQRNDYFDPDPEL
jgi:hypothetical protein